MLAKQVLKLDLAQVRIGLGYLAISLVMSKTVVYGGSEKVDLQARGKGWCVQASRPQIAKD